MKIVVTGANGQLGRVLTSTLERTHTVIGIDLNQLNVTDQAAVMAFMLDYKPDMVIHAAALTRVDYCAENPDEALWVNAYGTKHVALACQAVDAVMVYISSNEVFDGTNSRFYLEYDQPHPINPYGYSKWVGEQMVRDLLTRFYIVRTSWLFGHGGRNFIHVMRDLAVQGKPLRVVVNEVSTPTYVLDLVDGLGRLIETKQFGIYHLVNEGRASRWTFARTILDLIGYADTPIEKITAAEYKRASTPPEYTVLRNFAGASLGIQLRNWQEAVAAFLAYETELTARG